ncbi:hypothetical protein UVI_02022250 [Ustilaginoidea virens]|uniref:Uncharacterized protein n=1 Tax=Ustilaginoidea virens TaxID=1159556 RepID=A0A1B5L0S6_USTVR|nr:hypothetical protein UVI_02022250 [Ustilaginoidea virens]
MEVGDAGKDGDSDFVVAARLVLDCMRLEGGGGGGGGGVTMFGRESVAGDVAEDAMAVLVPRVEVCPPVVFSNAVELVLKEEMGLSVGRSSLADDVVVNR